MKTYTKALAKGAFATVAAGAMVASAVTPAAARDRHDRDEISAGEVIAGALVIGGIAAMASAASNRDYNYDRAGYDPRWNRNRGYGYGNNYGNPRQAVQMCVQAAERAASRYSYGRADVTDVRDIDRNARGYTVRGRIAVNAMGRGWNRGDPYYGRGWDNDYRGWNSNLRGYDSGSFKCRVEYGRVVDIDFSGIRGL
ncbi:hypothetical protein [Novosphingobium sp. TH158]|uniref:hypothetical protein n=1 Tax=Novosphingobium sp. TH158 TaxID=2067455 RepID=UPI000C79732A|nr:hypothetical protein [Novosphingobium sp. TH158]PLK25490.1 hypothetical protein C0V78_00235 [Novosphingobium sp. TH158]